MSGLDALRDSLHSDFDAQMASNAAATLFTFENVEHFKTGGSTTPQDPPELSKSTPPWCRYQVRTSDNVDITRSFRHDFGFAVVQVFGAPGLGTKQVGDLAETIATNFRRRRVVIAGRDAIQYGSVQLKEVGIDPEGWYQQNVLARWDRVDAQ